MHGRLASLNAAPDEPSPCATATHSRHPPRVAGATARLDTAVNGTASTPYILGLDAGSPLARVSSTELEADCLCLEILNMRDSLHEPLRSARRDVRLVQSLNQIWADEAQRRRVHGLPPLASEDATPASEVARRIELPKPPPEVQRDLAVLERTLSQPPPSATTPPLPRGRGLKNRPLFFGFGLF